jgi:hypothetical protein
MPAKDQLPRRMLEELLAIHSVERDIHDVIVEGTSDRNLIEWFLLENSRIDFAVYEVGLFEIDPGDVMFLGLEDNNRGRVITMAYALSKSCDRKSRITCVADRDFDEVLEKEHDCHFLLLTDYTCMLMYTFSKRVLGKYIRFRLKGFKKSASQLIREISEALQTLFAVRLAKHVLRLGLKPVKWQDCCSLEEAGVELDTEDYLDRYLNKNAQHHSRVQIASQIQECRDWMRFDPRLQIKGHDFMAMFIWYVSHHPGFGAFARRTDESVEDELLSCVEIRDLEAENLFRKLLAQVDT